MATITLTVPNAVATRITAMLRDEYAAMIPGGTTDVEVFKLVLRFWLKKKLATYEEGLSRTSTKAAIDTAKAASEAAAAAAIADAEDAADLIT